MAVAGRRRRGRPFFWRSHRGLAQQTAPALDNVRLPLAPAGAELSHVISWSIAVMAGPAGMSGVERSQQVPGHVHVDGDVEGETLGTPPTHRVAVDVARQDGTPHQPETRRWHCERPQDVG